MNILLINHYAGSPYHGMEFRPYYLAREWVRAGHQVQIVAGSYSHIRSRQPQVGTERCSTEIIDGITYRWYRTPIYQGNGLRRAFSMVAFIASIWRDGRAIARDFRPDVVIASSTYPMDIWPARHIAQQANAKLIYEVHDLWPLSPIELGGMSKKHPFILWVQQAEDYAYRHADKVVSLLPETLKYMQSRGLDADKFIYIPNGVDEEEWAEPTSVPQDVIACLTHMKSDGRPIVAYVGTHGLANALDVLLDAAGQLRGQAQFLLVGPGPERERLASRIRDERLEHVTMLPSIPKRSVPTLLKEVDIAYIGLQPSPLFRFGISPNKLLDYMMSAKPILMAVDSGNDPVTEANCGLMVSPGDSFAVAQGISQLMRLSPEERAEMGENGRNFVLKNHTYASLAKSFLSVLRE